MPNIGDIRTNQYGENEILSDEGILVYMPRTGNEWLVGMFDGVMNKKQTARISVGSDYLGNGFVSRGVIENGDYAGLDEHLPIDILEYIELKTLIIWKLID